MSQQLLTKTHLIKWCDEQVANGIELKIGWEGGNDSGWVYMIKNGVQVEYNQTTDEEEELTDLMHTHLEYGSWAGEYSANGEATYDPELKAFVGEDSFGGDDSEDWSCDLKITIPKTLWFDRVEYSIEGDDPEVQFAFVINNGFKVPEHDAVAENICVKMKKAVDKEIKKFQEHLQVDGPNEFRSLWQDEQIALSEFVEQGDNLVYTIESLSMGTLVVEEKEVILELLNDDDDN